MITKDRWLSSPKLLNEQMFFLMLEETHWIKFHYFSIYRKKISPDLYQCWWLAGLKLWYINISAAWVYDVFFKASTFHWCGIICYETSVPRLWGWGWEAWPVPHSGIFLWSPGLREYTGDNWTGIGSTSIGWNSNEMSGHKVSSGVLISLEEPRDSQTGADSLFPSWGLGEDTVIIQK